MKIVSYSPSSCFDAYSHKISFIVQMYLFKGLPYAILAQDLLVFFFQIIPEILILINKHEQHKYFDIWDIFETCWVFTNIVIIASGNNGVIEWRHSVLTELNDLFFFSDVLHCCYSSLRLLFVPGGHSCSQLTCNVRDIILK